MQVLLSPPDTGELEIKYVTAAMRSGWIAPAGPDLLAFEQEIAARVGVAHAVGLSSGTAALHLALHAWGVGPGDVVPVSTLTFAATVNAIRYVGAEPHFVDCDSLTGNVNPELLARALESLTSSGRRVPVVIPVDMLGKCVDYDRIEEIAREHSTRLLCDAAESFGATHDGRPAGSFGNASVFSFNGNKILTTSGGGMLLTEESDLAAQVRKLSTQAREAAQHYEHKEIGFNYRLSNILAALGRAQLVRFDGMLKRRRSWRERYRRSLAEQPGVVILGGSDDHEDNCWLTAAVVDPRQSPWTRDDLAQAMDRAGVETRPVWKPMHRQPVNAGYTSTLDGSADLLFAHGITLPSGSSMTDEQFDLVESVIEEFTSA